MIDAGLRAIALLKERTNPRSRILLFIGQPIDNGSSAKLNVLEAQAERENVQVYALTLPLLGKSFVSDAFALQGLGSQWYKGGYKRVSNSQELFPPCGEPDRSEPTAIRFRY